MDSRNQESDDRRGGSLFRSRSGHLSGYVPKGVRPSHWKPNSLSKVPAAFLRFELADRLIAFLLAMRLFQLQLSGRPASAQLARSSLSPGASRSSDDLQGIASRLVALGRMPVSLERCARSDWEGGSTVRELLDLPNPHRLTRPDKPVGCSVIMATIASNSSTPFQSSISQTARHPPTAEYRSA